MINLAFQVRVVLATRSALGYPEVGELGEAAVRRHTHHHHRERPVRPQCLPDRPAPDLLLQKLHQRAAERFASTAVLNFPFGRRSTVNLFEDRALSSPPFFAPTNLFDLESSERETMYM